MKFISFLFFASSFLMTPTAQAFEMLGLVAYDMGTVETKPANYVSTQNGLGYAFFGRLDLGPGKLESGFIYAPTGITTHSSFDVKTTGSYWMIPVLYRYSFYEPFFSLAAGFDYAFVGNTSVSVAGVPVNNPSTGGYQSHFGAQVSVEATQDLGENLSIVLDVRYRRGLQNAISFNGTDSKYHFVMIALGLQKNLL